MYPTLHASYKNRFAFRLGTTSFIYPDSYAVNVRLLAPCFDEIELLMFESPEKGSLPGREEIASLQQLAGEFGIRYNVHLPYDVAPGGRCASQRRQAVAALIQVIERTQPLDPTTYTLHLSCEENLAEADAISGWQDRVRQTLDQIVGPVVAGRSLSIENLDYSLKWLDEIILDFDLALCLDIGHLLVSGNDLTETYVSYRDRIALIHLHGAVDGRDHLSLDQLSLCDRHAVARILKNYSGSVSLEVFRFEDLCSSLAELEKIQDSWEDRTTPTQGRGNR